MAKDNIRNEEISPHVLSTTKSSLTSNYSQQLTYAHMVFVHVDVKVSISHCLS